jgi:hypothetical protein
MPPLAAQTFEAEGLPTIGRLALANARGIAPMIQWNEQHGIRWGRLGGWVAGRLAGWQAGWLAEVCEESGELHAMQHSDRVTIVR